MSELVLDTHVFVWWLEGNHKLSNRCIIAATAKLIESRCDVVLVTRDKAIRNSRLVPTIWE